MLEVGCAHGWFMEQAQTQYHVQGIEPDTAIAALAAAKGFEVRPGFFPDALTDAEDFDVIIFNDVLEHIPDVRAVLTHCHAHLATGGHVVINAPDSHGFFYHASKWLACLGRIRSFERMWQVGLPSPHLYYFDTRSVARLAQLTGFTLEKSLALPAILTQGLEQRIHYAGGNSRIKARLLAGCIRALMPLIAVSNPDIRVWLLKKRPDAAKAARGSESINP
jgi:SAM-dependent methyltransferase